MNIIQISILGVIGILFALQFKQEKAQIAIALCVVISLIVFLCITKHLELLVNVIREIGNNIDVDASYITTLIKMLGITYLAEFASGICKDAGYQTIATQIEMFGKITILVYCIPILLALLRTIQEFFA